MTHHLPTTVKPLIGKTIKSLTRQASHAFLLAFEDSTEVTIYVLGDCCSHSIFYGSEEPIDLKGAILEDINEGVPTETSLKEAGEKAQLVDPDFFLEELSIWDIVITTSKGPIKLHHINSSNGYYDGYTEYKTNINSL